MAQGDGRCTVPKSRRKTSTQIEVLENRIIKARTDHELRCGCLLARGKFYHYVHAVYDGVKQKVKGHAGPCPKSGVIN